MVVIEELSKFNPSVGTAVLASLARRCPPLDVHTSYTYWVLAEYAGKSSFILRDTDSDENIGFITSAVIDGCGFIWQIGILPKHRGFGYSKLLIEAASEYLLEHVDGGIQVTIADDNKASFCAFASFCAEHGYTMEKTGVSVVSVDGVEHRETIYAIAAFAK